MPSIGSLLSIAQSGLRTQQSAMNVAAHNIANASTEGFSRQRAAVTGAPAVRTPDGVFGTGARVDDVRRIADPLLDGSFRREVAASSEPETRAGTLARVEAILGEPSEIGLAARLDALFNTFSELATDPGSTNVRTVLRQRAAQVTDKLHQLAADLDAVREDVEARLAAGVDDVNATAGAIATLNRQIVVVEADGTTAGDLRDQRDRLLDRLADLMPIQVREREGGAVGVTVAGIAIVDGDASREVEVRSAGGVTSLAAVGQANAFQDSGGRLGGLLAALNTDLPATRQALDDIAAALVAEVNALHRTGTNPLGATGVDFFDPAGVTATSIALSVDVVADARAIAAGTPDSSGAFQAGANDVALALAGLRDGQVAALGDTLLGSYRGLVSDIGAGVRSARDAAETHRTLADRADIQRAGVTGVSLDEELVRLIQSQSSFQAAARVVSVADAMLQSLLDI